MIVCKHVYPTKTGGCNHYPDGGIACENGCLLQVVSYFRFARMGVIQRGGGYTLPSKSPLAVSLPVSSIAVGNHRFSSHNHPTLNHGYVYNCVYIYIHYTVYVQLKK